MFFVIKKSVWLIFSCEIARYETIRVQIFIALLQPLSQHEDIAGTLRFNQQSLLI